MTGELTLQKKGPKDRQAGAHHLAIVLRQVALAPPRDQPLRQASRERKAGQGPVARALRQDIDGNGQTMFDDRLRQQRLEQIGLARSQGVAPEQLGIDQRLDLSGLGWRNSISAQPLMARRGRICMPALQGAARQGPGRNTGPLGQPGEIGWRERPRTETPEAVDDHVRIGGVVEHGVAALTAEDARGSGRRGAAGHVRVIGHVQAVQAGTKGLPHGHQLLDRDRRRRFLGDGQAQAQRLGRRLGIGPLVALPPGAAVVDEISVA